MLPPRQHSVGFRGRFIAQPERDPILWIILAIAAACLLLLIWQRIEIENAKATVRDMQRDNDRIIKKLENAVMPSLR